MARIPHCVFGNIPFSLAFYSAAETIFILNTSKTYFYRIGMSRDIVF